MPERSDTSRKRPALGLGLNALIPMNASGLGQDTTDDLKEIEVGSLVPNPYQPRRIFSEDTLKDLAESIKEIGVIQPIIARHGNGSQFEIVAGERRWRAAQLAGYSVIPVIVRKISDAESLEIALIENIQREDLNPMDTAEAYDMLVKKFSYTHDVLAKRLGKDRTSITNYLRLLKLPDPIKEDVRCDRISMGHARTLLSVEHEPTQISLAGRVLKRKLSVRELERIVQNFKSKEAAKAEEEKNVAKEPDRSEFLKREEQLSQLFQTQVQIKTKGDAGKIELKFDSQTDFDRLVALLVGSEQLS